MKINSTAIAILLIANGLAACTSPTVSTSTNSNALVNANSSPSPGANGGVTSAHGGSSAPNVPMATSIVENLDTAAYDAKITQAEAKAKQPNASDADKRAAATAYVERGNVFYNAGVPTYYKFALRDFRIALKYQPDNAEAKEKRDMIVSIYNSMGRPVPDLGN